METKYYIAYGSNLNKAQMRRRCPDAEIAGTGFLDNSRLRFRRGVLDVAPEQGQRVPVAVWKVSASDERALDVYEGFPRLYRKESLSIRMTDAKTGAKRTVGAFIYLMNRGEDSLPTAVYFHTCMQGYRDFGFSPDALWAAYNHCREV